MKEYLKRIRVFLLISFKYKFSIVGKNIYCGRNLFIRKKSVKIGNNVYKMLEAVIKVHYNENYLT